jgi:hypothetical protein
LITQVDFYNVKGCDGGGLMKGVVRGRNSARRSRKQKVKSVCPTSAKQTVEVDSRRSTRSGVEGEV